MFFRRKPGTALGRIPIPTTWTPALVKGLLAYQRTDREGMSLHFLTVIVQAMRSEVGGRDDERELFGFCVAGGGAIPVRITLAPMTDEQWDRARARDDEFVTRAYGPPEVIRDRRVHGQVYWVGRPSDGGDEEDRRPGLEGTLRLPAVAFRTTVEDLRASLRPGTRPPRLSMRFFQCEALTVEGLLQTLQNGVTLHFDVAGHWLTTYAIQNAAGARENRFFRRVWADDIW